MPSPKTSPPPADFDFQLTAFIRANMRDANLRPGEGARELDAAAAAFKAASRTARGPLRGHVIPLPPMARAESGGLSAGDFGAGGALVSGSITLAAALQPVLQLQRLGSRRINAQAGDQVISPPAIISGGWVAEDQDGTAAQALFAAALREPKESYTRVKMSRRLLQQSGGVAEQEMRALLERSIAATIEAGLLAGSGSSSEPMGMVNDPQLQRRSFTGSALPTRARVGELVSELLEVGADLEQVQILAAAADFDASQSGTAPLVEVAPDGRRRLATLPVSFSPHVPSGTAIIADWSRVAVAYVGPPTLIVDPYSEGESGALLMTLFQQVSYAVERRELLTVAIKES